jgi:hypothetical protein
MEIGKQSACPRAVCSGEQLPSHLGAFWTHPQLLRSFLDTAHSFNAPGGCREVSQLRWGGERDIGNRCSDAHFSGVIVELLSAFQARDVSTGRLAIVSIDRRDRSGDESVMATK